MITREQWGARPPAGSGNELYGTGKGYALHWEGPEMGTRPHSECDNLMRSIQAFHMDDRGWSDIAYNLAVCEHGYVYEGRGKGKGSGANGTSDANHHYPSICALVGENDPQTAALDDGISEAVALLRSWGVGSGAKGHRDFVSTECPGDDLYDKQRAGRYDNPTTTPGDDEMPDYTQWKRTTDDRIPGDAQWHDLLIDDDGNRSWAGEHRTAIGTLTLTLTGLPAGNVVQLRPVRVGVYDGSVAAGAVVEVIGTNGSTYGQVSKLITTGNDQRARWQVLSWDDVTITGSVTESLVW